MRRLKRKIEVAAVENEQPHKYLGFRSEGAQAHAAHQLRDSLNLHPGDDYKDVKLNNAAALARELDVRDGYEGLLVLEMNCLARLRAAIPQKRPRLQKRLCVDCIQGSRGISRRPRCFG